MAFEALGCSGTSSGSFVNSLVSLKRLLYNFVLMVESICTAVVGSPHVGHEYNLITIHASFPLSYYHLKCTRSCAVHASLSPRLKYIWLKVHNFLVSIDLDDQCRITSIHRALHLIVDGAQPVPDDQMQPTRLVLIQARTSHVSQ